VRFALARNSPSVWDDVEKYLSLRFHWIERSAAIFASPAIHNATLALKLPTTGAGEEKAMKMAKKGGVISKGSVYLTPNVIGGIGDSARQSSTPLAFQAAGTARVLCFPLTLTFARAHNQHTDLFCFRF
jgi:hypothetical protein